MTENINTTVTPRESNLDKINSRIENEVCYRTIEKLNDTNILEECKRSKSVKKRIQKYNETLYKHGIDREKREEIIDDLITKGLIIPAGTKGVIRGNKFNKIVKQKITDMNLDPNLFDICFETPERTSETPDFYIKEKKSNKTLIGMNQADLWNGGAQLNRGYKYLINNQYNNNRCKLLCVVCNYIHFTKKNKAFKLFEVGFSNNTLCYIKNLRNIISTYFNLV